MKVLITGITGMVGGHLGDFYAENGWEVVGFNRSTSNLRQLPSSPHRIVVGELMDRDSVFEIIKKEQPDLVIHMAAQAFNSISWNVERYTHEVNFTGTLNVLHAARIINPSMKILLAGSSATYGHVQQYEGPLQEDRPLRPISPYGVSKVSVECLGYQYFQNYGQQVFLPRLFIHMGVGHPPNTAVQNFARQIALIATKQIAPVIRTGRLDTIRDMIDVRDGAEAMYAVLSHGEAGKAVNICTGDGVTMRDVLTMFLQLSGVQAKILHDNELIRPSDESCLIGSNERLRALGWKRRYTLEDTLERILEDWMRRVCVAK